jgi:acyl-CoA thioesterase II
MEPTGDFARDTSVEGGDGRYRANLADAWALWGPAGGYVSTIALRAAGDHSRFGRPASYSCSYLGVADFGPVDIETVTLRSAKRAEAVRVSMTQEGESFLEAVVWTIDTGMEGLEHDVAPMPEVPRPDGLKAWIDETAQDRNPYARFWSNIEERMIEQWFGDWREHPAGPPLRDGWYRFRPSPTFDDPFLDAARSLTIVDTMGWPAAMTAYPDRQPFVAPTIELSVRFHRDTRRSEWLYGRTDAPLATEGLLWSTAMVWSEDGSLAASGGQHMLFRPVPR